MTSEINNQVATIETLIVPQGINIATNSSPSLTPSSGSLAYDKAINTSTYNNVFLGTGTNWVALPSSLTTLTASFDLTKSGQPSFTGCTASLATHVVGQVMFKMISINITQTITSTASGIWSSPAAVFPPQYYPVRPPSTSYTLYLPCYLLIGGTVTATYFSIDNTGAVNLALPSSGVTIVTSLPGCYV